jgi:AcrR family transcriptional regulator
MTNDESASRAKLGNENRQCGLHTAEVSTRESIMQTAVKILGRDGMSGLTTRAIAREAGVNQALINYHYQNKSNLLLQMARALETEKYVRQSSLYAEPGVPLSRRWRQAIEYYRQDLEDGYIRLNQELRYLAITNREIAQAWAERQQRWFGMLEKAAASYLPELEIDIPPAYVADAICSLWYGMDQRLIIRTPDSQDEIFEILEYIAEWLEEREQQYGIDPDN